MVQHDNVEAAAIAFAREWLDDYRAGFEREANRVFARGMLKEYALQHPFHLSALADDARAGWGDARDAMDKLLVDFHARGHMSPQLHSYAIDAKNPLLPRMT